MLLLVPMDQRKHHCQSRDGVMVGGSDENEVSCWSLFRVWPNIHHQVIHHQFTYLSYCILRTLLLMPDRATYAYVG